MQIQSVLYSGKKYIYIKIFVIYMVFLFLFLLLFFVDVIIEFKILCIDDILIFVI